MISFANTQLQGNIGNVEINETNGKKYAVVSVATQESYKDGNGEWVNNTHWHRVVTFNQGTVKYIQNNAQKGRQIYVNGDLKVNTYEDTDGNKRTSTEIHPNQIELGPKKETEGE